MHHLIDLDDLVARLSGPLERWSEQATVWAPTWRDESPSWPSPIVEDRTAVQVPESLGIHVEIPDGEIQVVVWTGGWADVAGLTRGVELVAAPEFANTDEAHDAVVQAIDHFLHREIT
jgi:hypothetical protein